LAVSILIRFDLLSYAAEQPAGWNLGSSLIGILNVKNPVGFLVQDGCEEAVGWTHSAPSAPGRSFPSSERATGPVPNITSRQKIV
jgi:hypothetical protein